MARATVTVRELKNKDTGIDLSVTSYKETKGMLGSTYEYQVMVVSNLSYFKTAKHKETDNVQFTVFKKLGDFEEIYNKFNTKYSGTAFPQLPKKVLMMNESIAKERRNNLDHFLRYLASMPKLCTDPVLLEFLGVSAIKAGKLKKLEVSESKANKEDNSAEQTGKGDTEEEANTENNDKDVNLFDDEDDDKQDDDDDDNDLFTTEDVSADSKVDLKIFDEPDLSGALEEGEGEDLFITGSRSDTKVTSTALDEDKEEKTDDLFSVDDDLDKIMKMKIRTKDDKSAEEENNSTEQTLDDSVPKTEAEIEKDIPPKTKPVPRAKPPIPKRKDQANEAKETEKPSVSDFDSVTVETEKIKTDSSVKENGKPKPAVRKKPDIAGKPGVKPKPGLKPKPVVPTKPTSVVTSSADKTAESDTATSAVEDITEDDIMKYIQDNTQDNTDDLDLFS